MEEVGIVGQTGDSIEDLVVGQTGMIFSKIKNTVDFLQDFTYIVQIKDENSDVVLLSWVTGQTMPSQEVGMSISWMPEKSGKYLVERFVWNSIKGAIPLTDTITYEILVK
jgi:hypothetical protein